MFGHSWRRVVVADVWQHWIEPLASVAPEWLPRCHSVGRATFVFADPRGCGHNLEAGYLTEDAVVPAAQFHRQLRVLRRLIEQRAFAEGTGASMTPQQGCKDGNGMYPF